MAPATLAPLNMIQCMCDGNSIGKKNEMMKDIKDPIGNDAPQVRCDCDGQKKAKDDIARNHYLSCKFLTEGIISVTAIDPKEH